MRKFPQVLLNVKVAKRFDPSTVPAVQEAVQRIEKRMGGDGRVVLRASGTEPVIRVMVEGKGESCHPGGRDRAGRSGEGRGGVTRSGRTTLLSRGRWPVR